MRFPTPVLAISALVVAFSPDVATTMSASATVAGASTPGPIDTTTAEPAEPAALRQLWSTSPIGGSTLRHSDSVSDVEYSPDGTLVVTAGLQDDAAVWDAATGERLHVLVGHGDPVNAAMFSPDGATLATTGWDGSVRTWDVDSGTELAVLEHDDGGKVLGAAFDSDGARLVSWTSAGEVRIWDVAAGELVHDLFAGLPDDEPQDGTIRGAAFSPDSTLVAAAGRDDDFVTLWDTASGDVVSTWRASRASSVAFSADGKELYFGWAGGVSVKPIGQADSDGRRFVTSSEASIVDMAVDTAAGRLFAGDGTGAAWSWDLAGREAIVAGQRLGEHTERVADVTISPDGSLAASGSEDGSAIIWDLVAGHELHVLRPVDNPSAPLWMYQLAFSPDGTRLATAQVAAAARIWDVTTGDEVQPIEAPVGPIKTAVFSPDGSLVAAGGEDTDVWVWSTADGTLRNRLRGQSTSLRYVAVSADNTLVASGAADGTVMLWDLASGDVSFSTTVSGSIEALAVRPDHNVVGVVADDALADEADTSVVVWARDGSVAARVDGYAEAAVLADGSTIVWEDGSLHLLDIDARTGDDLSVPTADIAWWLPSNDGGMLVVSSGTGAPIDPSSSDGELIAAGDGQTVVINGSGVVRTVDMSIATGDVASVASTDSVTVTASSNGTVMRAPAEPAEPELVLFDHSDSVTAAAINGDSSLYATGGRDHQLHVRDSDGRLVASATTEQTPDWMNFVDGTLIVVDTWGVAAWDVSSPPTG